MFQVFDEKNNQIFVSKEYARKINAERALEFIHVKKPNAVCAYLYPVGYKPILKVANVIREIIRIQRTNEYDDIEIRMIDEGRILLENSANCEVIMI